MAFAIEEIPDNADLFRRIHRNHVNGAGVISSQAFKQPRLSVNWNKYSDPQSTADQNSAAVTALVCGNVEGWVKRWNILRFRTGSLSAQIRRTPRFVEINHAILFVGCGTYSR